MEQLPRLYLSEHFCDEGLLIILPFIQGCKLINC
jgi:hypothetical protein